MNRFEPWMVSAIAPAATSGEPEAVTQSLLRIATALERGIVVDRSVLRWPVEPLRSAILDSLAASEIANRIAGRVAAIAVVLSNIVDMVEAAWSIRRRIERGRAQAGPADARSALTLELLWEPLALRGVRAQADECWRWLDRIQRRERAMDEWLRSIALRFDDERTEAPLLLDLLRIRRDDVEVTRLERELAFEGTEATVRPPDAPLAESGGWDVASRPERARARRRARMNRVDEWTRRALEPEGVAADVRWVRRKGAVFVCVERDRGATDDESDAVAAIGCAAAIAHSRRCVLLTSDEKVEATEIDAQTSLRTVIAAIRRHRRSSGLDAVRRAVGLRGRDQLEDCDVLLAVPVGWAATDAFEAALRPLHDKLRLANGRVCLLRPQGTLTPFGYEFDRVYLLDTSGVVSDER